MQERFADSRLLTLLSLGPARDSFDLPLFVSIAPRAFLPSFTDRRVERVLADGT